MNLFRAGQVGRLRIIAQDVRGGVVAVTVPTVGALEIPELAICSQSSSSLNLDISPPAGPSADSICSILNDTRRFGPEGPPPDDRQLRPGSLLLGPAPPPPKAGGA